MIGRSGLKDLFLESLNPEGTRMRIEAERVPGTEVVHLKPHKGEGGIVRKHLDRAYEFFHRRLLLLYIPCN